MYIFLLVLGGGQDKPAWTACPPGVKITRVGGKISRDSLPPGGQGNRGWLAPRGATCPGGKINWDTGSHTFVQMDHEIISTVNLLPSADSFKKGCCHLQAKVCAQSTG